MEIQPDFKDLLKLFNENNVEYVIVGGYALAFHGAPRFTGDIDLYVRPTQENAKSIIAALESFGFGELDLSSSDFQIPNCVVQLGVPPVRIDIITSIDGVSWETTDKGKASGEYGDITVSYIGREELLANKHATGRKKDLADIEALGEN